MTPLPTALPDPKIRNRWRVALATAMRATHGTLPVVVTVPLAALFATLPEGAALAAGTIAAVLALGFWLLPELREDIGTTLLTAVVYTIAIALPALLLPPGGGLIFLAAAALETAILVAVLRFPPPRVRLDLLPDLLTALSLLALFGLPVLARRARRARQPRPKPPWRIALLLTSFDEEATIETCLASLRRAIDACSGHEAIRSIRLLLADSASSDRTRELAAPMVDGVIDCPRGKLSARHHATLIEDCDLVVAIDADRSYDEDWLRRLLTPFLDDPEVVAVTGETRIGDEGVSGSEVSRKALCIPFNGGNSAYFREVYLRVPFDLSIDEFQHRYLWREEEFLFPLTLASQGRVVHAAGCVSRELRPYGFARVIARHLFGTRLRTF